MFTGRLVEVFKTVILETKRLQAQWQFSKKQQLKHSFMTVKGPNLFKKYPFHKQINIIFSLLICQMFVNSFFFVSFFSENITEY